MHQKKYITIKTNGGISKKNEGNITIRENSFFLTLGIYQYAEHWMQKESGKIKTFMGQRQRIKIKKNLLLFYDDGPPSANGNIHYSGMHE